ncbi:MAG TPA: hypothetical protein VGL35_10295 [Rhizomicrobium sp.]
MAGLDPATQPASVREPKSIPVVHALGVVSRADARLLGGRLEGRPWCV